MQPEKALIEQIVQAASSEISWPYLWRYALGAVVGGAGGCAVAAALKAKGIKITRWIVLSYAAVGGFASVMFLAMFRMQGWIELSLEDIIVYGGSSCLIVVGIISGVNVSLHFSARKLGQDLTQVAGLTVELDKDKDKSDDMR